MTRKEIIIAYLKNPKTKLSCQDIVKRIIKEQKLPADGSVANYLSGSISSLLADLVRKGILRYAKERGPRGGHIYQKNPKNKIPKFIDKPDKFPHMNSLISTKMVDEWLQKVRRQYKVKDWWGNEKFWNVVEDLKKTKPIAYRKLYKLGMRWGYLIQHNKY